MLHAQVMAKAACHWLLLVLADPYIRQWRQTQSQVVLLPGWLKQQPQVECLVNKPQSSFVLVLPHVLFENGYQSHVGSSANPN